MRRIAVVERPSVKFEYISFKDYKKMMEESIKEWHFEKSGDGVIPVKGKYDPTNSNHVKKVDVLEIIDNGVKVKLKD